ncbi:MAG: flagellar export protein FliJ [candidate division KSB1 bacterium]|nr:flagellar export protein FliJ [candidate division KSB1 bacterium]
MKPFKFTLEQVLHLKEGLKKQLAGEVYGLEQQEAQVQKRLEKLSNEWRQESDALSREASSLLSAEYRLRATYLDYLNQQIEDERQRLMEISRHLAIKREKLLQYAREQKILEKIREKKRIEFHKAEKKREQKQIDELSTLRYQRDIGESIHSQNDSDGLP